MSIKSNHLCDVGSILLILIVAGSAFAVDPATFVARFNEGLQLMKALWSEPQVTFEGRFWQLKNVPMEPKP